MKKKNTAYFYDKYQGQKGFWRDNFHGILCGFTDTKLLFTNGKKYVDGKWLRCPQNPNADTRLFYIGMECDGGYTALPISSILDMDYEDSIFVGKHKQAWVGNIVWTPNGHKTITKISKNVRMVWFDDGSSDHILYDTMKNFHGYSKEGNRYFNMLRLEKGERLYDNEFMKNY